MDMSDCDHPIAKSNASDHDKAAADKDFDVFIPKLVQTTNFDYPDTSVSCPGCFKTFEAKHHKHRKFKYIPVPEFFVHCLKDCPKYRELGIHTRCFGCKKLFMKETNFTYHLRSYKKCKAVSTASNIGDCCDTDAKAIPPKKKTKKVKAVDPDILLATDPSVKAILAPTDIPPDSPTIDKECPGCRRIFTCPFVAGADERVMMSKEMIHHLIFDCPDYLSQGIIKTCHSCDVKFFDEESYNFHNNFVCPILNTR